jgi:KAP family P-loop domain
MSDEKTNDLWHDDLLSRKTYAQFLSKIIRQRCEPVELGGPRRSFTMALDGDWGAGKTFFVKRWSEQLRESESLPVVFFDAWKCDSTTEPLSALTSELRQQIEPLVNELPSAKKIKQSTSEALSAATTAARKTVLPVAKITAAILLKQLAGVSIDRIEAVIGEAGDGEDSEDAKSISEASIEKISEKLSQQLEIEYETRKKSIEAFRSNLEKTIDSLVAHNIVTAPMVVFIDELDRCRPDFAIKLIETVKHLFDIRGCCFVISTNTKQLAEAVRAVYGNGFDAQHYLQRFFDLVYRLPSPSDRGFVDALFKNWPTEYRARCIDNSYIDASGSQLNVDAHLFSVVCDEFELDLRSRKKAFDTALAAASGIAANTVIHAFFLFYLCALYTRRRDLWDSFWTRTKDVEQRAKWHGLNIRNETTSLHLDNKDFETFPNEELPVSKLVTIYRRFAHMTIDQLREKIRNIRADDSGSIENTLVSNFFARPGNGLGELQHYRSLVELAGQAVR